MNVPQERRIREALLRLGYNGGTYSTEFNSPRISLMLLPLTSELGLSSKTARELLEGALYSHERYTFKARVRTAVNALVELGLVEIIEGANGKTYFTNTELGNRLIESNPQKIDHDVVDELRSPRRTNRPQARARTRQPTSQASSRHEPSGKVQMYCTNDNKLVEIADPRVEDLADGISVVRGTCPLCGSMLTVSNDPITVPGPTGTDSPTGRRKNYITQPLKPLQHEAASAGSRQKPPSQASPQNKMTMGNWLAVGVVVWLIVVVCGVINSAVTSIRSFLDPAPTATPYVSEFHLTVTAGAARPIEMRPSTATVGPTFTPEPTYTAAPTHVAVASGGLGLTREEWGSKYGPVTRTGEGYSYENGKYQVAFSDDAIAMWIYVATRPEPDLAEARAESKKLIPDDSELLSQQQFTGAGGGVTYFVDTYYSAAISDTYKSGTAHYYTNTSDPWNAAKPGTFNIEFIQLTSLADTIESFTITLGNYDGP